MTPRTTLAGSDKRKELYEREKWSLAAAGGLLIAGGGMFLLVGLALAAGWGFPIAPGISAQFGLTVGAVQLVAGLPAYCFGLIQLRRMGAI